MNVIRKGLGSVVLALGLAAAPAQAILITGTGDDFVIVWNQFEGTNQLRATATFDVTTFTTNQVVISIDIANLSVLTTFVNAGLASFGLETIPQATSLGISNAAGVFQNATIENIPSLNFINLCVWAGNNCAGGPQGQLLAVGATDDDIILTINGDFSNGLDVVNSGVKFQTSGGSFEFPGTICLPGTPQCGIIQVPEPSSLVLLGLGALAFGIARRRRTF